MYSLGPNESLQRTAGLHSSQFVALWPAAAEFCRSRKGNMLKKVFVVAIFVAAISAAVLLYFSTSKARRPKARMNTMI
jgi:hypothetical protein